MSQQLPKFRARITRRDSFKVCLVPASAIAGGFLIACGGDRDPVASAAMQPAESAAGSPPSGAPSTMAAAAGGKAPAAAGNNMSSAPAKPASSAAMPTGALNNAGAGGAPASPATASAAGAGGVGAPASAASSGAGGASPVGAAGATAGGSTSGVAGPGVMWAAGGTKSMKGGYDDPFEMGMAGTMCRLYPAQTLGPCYADMPEDREDISDGATGLPLRLSLLVVRGGCEPIPGATVDIWHSGFDGVYSAYATGSVCNPGSMNVQNEMFCRGVRKTDESGKAHFNTIFPGWYSGRAVHIHFTVRVDGREEVTSQLYFDDDLTTEIQAQGEYAPRGMRPVLNDGDFIYRSGGATPEQVNFSTAKRPDGVLHAWKVLSIG